MNCPHEDNNRTAHIHEHNTRRIYQFGANFIKANLYVITEQSFVFSFHRRHPRTRHTRRIYQFKVNFRKRNFYVIT